MRNELLTSKPVPRPPIGYEIKDGEAWQASAPMLTADDIRELGPGGLERCGLRKSTKEVGW